MISMVSKAHIIVKNMHAEVKSRGVAFPLFVGLNEKLILVCVHFKNDKYKHIY